MATQTAFPRFRSDESRARFMAAYDAALKAWPISYEELDVPTRLGATHVIVSGPVDAPPLVLLPSFAGTALVWRLNVATLSQRFRLYAVDVIGQPGKSECPRRIRNRREFAGWFVDLLGQLGVERTSIVGCSFGAFLALNQAVETPERVDRVVLISPAGTFASQWWKLTYAMRVKAPLLRLARRLSRNRRKPSLASLGPRALPRDRQWAALIGATMAEAPKVSVINASVFTARQLRRIRSRCLLLIGARETLYDPAAMLKLARARMPQLETALVPDADHIAAMAQPDDVGDRILRFLAGA
jgi:pimeloyl-ACP methyl ester carboxylesterase